MASTSRPVRSRNQPQRNKDNVELNLQLIEKLEANRVSTIIMKGNRNATPMATNYAKLLSSFVNSCNEHYRTALSKIEPQKKEQPVSKPKLSDNPDHLEWGPSRDKKKYIIGSGAKSYSKAFQSSLPQEERQIEKNNNQITKITRTSRVTTPSDTRPVQQPAQVQIKEPKKVVVLTPTPQPTIEPKKPFKRSSYHIGIAYTIYMTQIRQANPNMVDPRNCDPTYYARKLKAEQAQK